jgi:hypothetical protein
VALLESGAKDTSALFGLFYFDEPAANGTGLADLGNS